MFTRVVFSAPFPHVRMISAPTRLRNRFRFSEQRVEGRTLEQASCVQRQ
jgi:hypothetical protein